MLFYAGNRTWTCTLANQNLNLACLPIPPYPLTKKDSFTAEKVFLMSHAGLEPATPWLKVKCSTAWASDPNYFSNWASWIRTNVCSSQSAVPYRLAIAHYACPPYKNQQLSLYEKSVTVWHSAGWIQGFEPWAFRATIWRANQLRYIHHLIFFLCKKECARRDSNPRPTA